MLTNDIGSYFIVIQTTFKQMLHIVGFYKGGFSCHQDVTFFKNWCLIFGVLFIMSELITGPPGSSCLAYVNKLWIGPVLKEKITLFVMALLGHNGHSKIPLKVVLSA